MVVFLLVGGALLAALSAVILVVAVYPRRKTQKLLSDGNYVAVCGSTFELMLGLIMIAYAYPKLYQ